MTLDCIIPARDEASTIEVNVAAALGCRHVREVVVVDDGSSDDTAGRAAAAGAKVVAIPGSAGSKAHAMRAGADASDADVLLFVDADCIGLTPTHLDELCEPVLAGRADQSVGCFDYGVWNAVVRRGPLLSGERCLRRHLFDAVPAHLLDGYSVELRINQVAAAQGLTTVVRTMHGVHQRTKRQKHGLVEGLRRDLGMYGALVAASALGGSLRARPRHRRDGSEGARRREGPAAARRR